MGVKRLWHILEPVGRRVDIATLRGCTVAVDMSVWLHAFLHGMRDQDGNLVPNAHLLGTFRRLVKLLYNHIKPIFVFDGGAPILKRRTLLLRQGQRMRQEARHMQALRKLLLNQQLQKVSHGARASAAVPDPPFSAVSTESAKPSEETERSDDAESGTEGSLTARPLKRLKRGGSATAAAASPAQPSVVAGHDLAGQDASGRVPPASDPRFSNASVFGDSDDWDEDAHGVFDDSVPVVPDAPEDADLSVVASLPPHLQAEFVNELKRKHRGATRNKLLPVAADPIEFSRVQMAAFLHGARFNTDIDRLNAAQAGAAGTSGKAIASEADRKYMLYDDDTESVAGVADPPRSVTPAPGSESQDLQSTPVASSAPENLSDRQKLQLFLGAQHARNAGRRGAASSASRGGGLVHASDFYGRGGWRGRGTGNSRVSRVVERMEASSRKARAIIAMVEGEGREPSSGELLSQYDRLLASSSSATAHVDNVMDSAAPVQHDEVDSAVERSPQRAGAGILGPGSESDGSLKNVAAPVVSELLSGTDADAEGAGFLVDADWDVASAPRDAADAERQQATHSAYAVPELSCKQARDDADGRDVLLQTDDLTCDEVGDGSGTNGNDEWEDVTDQAASPEESNFNRAHDGNVFLSADVDTLTAQDIEDAINASLDARPSHSDSALSSAAEHKGDKRLDDDGDGGVYLNDAQSVAITQAFELAGSMRGSAGHAFVSALKGLGRAIPIARGVASTESSGIVAMTDGSSPHSAHIIEKSDDSALQYLDRSASGLRDTDAADVGLETPWNMDVTAIPAGMFLSDPAHRDTHSSRSSSIAGIEELEAAEAALRTDLRSAAKGVGEVTETMTTEVMALLRLFGVPYVVAPMEAEAQCAALELAGIVQGVVSDDSDAFLFGSRCVYRNIFTEQKFVEVYRMEDVTRELGLSRDDLVRLALLLGSDYTEGVSGVGPVNALEVLRAFPGDEGLVEFREWLLSVHPEPVLTKEEVAAASAVTAFKARHRAARRNWQVSESFPSAAVLACYRNPTVHDIPPAAGGASSSGDFQWALPNLESLRILCTERFGWQTDRTDAHLLPLMREITAGPQQSTLDAFVSRRYEDSDRAAKIRSVRLRAAVEGITGESLVAAGIAEPSSLEANRNRRHNGGEAAVSQPTEAQQVSSKRVHDSQRTAAKKSGKRLRRQAVHSSASSSSDSDGHGTD